MERRRAIEELEEEYINNSNAPSTRRNKETHVSRYLDFCTFGKMRPYPVNEFKLCKYATHLANSMKTVQAIKAYCATVCEDNELKGYRPARRGLKFYRTIAGIQRNKHHHVHRAEPMTIELLMQIEQVVDVSQDKELAVWCSMLTGFFLVLRKSNLVPLKRVHDTVHNISRQDVKYSEGIMVIFIRWSKTNQLGQKIRPAPIVADNNNPICLVRWILHLVERVPAPPSCNLFSYRKGNDILPITYRDLMVTMRRWLDIVGQNSKKFSSHSLRRGATTTAFKANVPDVDIQRMGDWSSQCYRLYIEDDMPSRVKAWFKFNNKL